MSDELQQPAPPIERDKPLIIRHRRETLQGIEDIPTNTPGVGPGAHVLHNTALSLRKL